MIDKAMPWMRSTGLGLLAAALLVAGAQSCGGKNDLYGSVSQVDDLSYDSVVLGTQTGFITITYLRKSGEVPAKLAIDTNGLSLSSGATLAGADFISHVTVSRVVTDANQTFRPIVKGSISFDQYATSAGSALSGHFAITFDSGNLLQGDFSGNLVDQNSAQRFRATSAGDRAIRSRRN